MAAIYSTLGLAGSLVDYLRREDLLAAAFALGFVLVLAAIAGSALKIRPGRRETWVALGVASTYGMVAVRMGVSAEERTHLFEYGLVAVLIHEALRERARNGRRVPLPAVLAIVGGALLGWLDEGIQALIPNRIYDLRDVGTNAVACLLAITASLVLRRARRRDRQKSRS